MSDQRIVASDMDNTLVSCSDKPSHGGGCHLYTVTDKQGTCFLETIRFQLGPVKEHGVNGLTQEDLLAIVIDRLEHFQGGPYACPENEAALYKIKDARASLKLRTAQRKARGVEGTSQL